MLLQIDLVPASGLCLFSVNFLRCLLSFWIEKKKPTALTRSQHCKKWKKDLFLHQNIIVLLGICNRNTDKKALLSISNSAIYDQQFETNISYNENCEAKPLSALRDPLCVIYIQQSTMRKKCWCTENRNVRGSQYYPSYFCLYMYITSCNKLIQ